MPTLAAAQQGGQSELEYALALALVAIVVVVILIVFGATLLDLYSDLVTTLGNYL
jgi:Flp pilus assembly pilin Flp